MAPPIGRRHWFTMMAGLPQFGLAERHDSRPPGFVGGRRDWQRGLFRTFFYKIDRFPWLPESSISVAKTATLHRQCGLRRPGQCRGAPVTIATRPFRFLIFFLPMILFGILLLQP